MCDDDDLIFNKLKFLNDIIDKNKDHDLLMWNYGYYLEENKRKMFFENLTMVPIDKDLIICEKLNKNEKNWLNNYHKNVFKILKKFMNKNEVLDLKKACLAI